MHSPKITSSSEVTSIVIANSTDFSYPVRLGETLCWPKQLLACVNARGKAMSVLGPCCKEVTCTCICIL
jgi:hypothetical protein